MKLPERDVVTPVDDPCQRDADWRAVVSEYLFSKGVRTKEHLKSISATGCMEICSEHDGGEYGAKKSSKSGKKGRKKSQKGKDEQKKTLVPIEPFFEHAKYRKLAEDRWIAEHLAMCDNMDGGRQLEDRHASFLLAERWHDEDDSMEAAMKKRLEALLLTEAGIDVVALDLIGSVDAIPAVEAYEKMYFNCRDDTFEISPSMQLVSRIAMPYGPLKTYLKKWEELKDGYCVQDGRPLAKDSDIWKALGATMGYDTLMYAWNWDWRAHGIKDRSLKHKIECLWNLAVSKITTAMFTGDIKHEEAAKLLSSCTSQLKLISDSASGGGAGANDMSKAMMGMLYKLAPKMVTMDSRLSERNEEIESHIQSRLAIEKQDIQDRGSQVDEEIMESQISDAIEQ